MVFFRIFFVIILCVAYGCDNPNGNIPPAVEVNLSKSPKENTAGVKVIEEAQDESVVEKSLVANANGFMPFDIYSDKESRENHYVPSGFMGDWKCLDFDDKWKDFCHQGSTCIKIDYDISCSREEQRWAGVYWLNPPNNWGNRKGGYNLTGAEKLVFWAKGEKGGEQIQAFKIGGIGSTYPDTDTAMIGPVILSSVWKEYKIDLKGKDLSYISGGFAWTTSEEVNEESCMFYLDSIRFE